MKNKLFSLTMIFAIIFVSLIPLIPIIYAEEVTETFYVSHSYDDAHERPYGGYFSYTDDYVECVTYISPYIYSIGGFYFPEVSIPNNFEIVSAYFEGYVYQSTGICVDIYANDVDDAENFSEDQDIDGRVRTTNYVTWQGTIGTGWKTSPNLKNVLQEVINRPNWESGNAIVLLFITRPIPNVGIGSRFRSYDYSSSLSAKLEITWANQLINDYEFTDGYFCNHWKQVLPNWNGGEEDDEESIMYSGYWYGYSNDEDNWDFSEGIAMQGKKVHEAGYCCGESLIHEIELDDGVSDDVLICKIRMKIPATPNENPDNNAKRIIRISPINPFRSPSKNAVIGIFIGFEIYVHDHQNDYYWLDYSEDDWWGDPDMAVVEMFNRWSFDPIGGWYEVPSGSPEYDFYTQYTTHDNDYHRISCGWKFNGHYDEWKEFEVDIGSLFRDLCGYNHVSFGQQGTPYYIEKGKVKTVSVCVESYMAEFEGYVDSVVLLYYG